jgi:hypothetical protein
MLALAATTLLAMAPSLPQAPVPASGGQRVNADAKVMAEFEEQVKAYSALHRKLEATLPQLPKEAAPAQINQHQIALAQLIGKARAGARFGDIFTKETRALFRRYLDGVFAGPKGAELKAVVMDENPGKLQLHVNGRYPESIPVTTVPPQVLQALPKLPEDLEYRFIGDRLVLHDIHAHTIVDVVENALPK